MIFKILCKYVFFYIINISYTFFSNSSAINDGFYTFFPYRYFYKNYNINNIYLTNIINSIFRCESGDIRVKFEIIKPLSLTVVGKQLDKIGTIGTFYKKNFIYPTLIYPEYISYENSLSKNNIFLKLAVRFLFFLWNYFIFFIICKDFSFALASSFS